MRYLPERRPYDSWMLIEVYVLARRTDFVHPDFTNYYRSLLAVLEEQFGVRLSPEGLTFDRRVLWMLFASTVASLHAIRSPWSGFLEAGLLHHELEESGEPGRVVRRASAVIDEANQTSAAAHREILHALLQAMFGDFPQPVTSDQLREAGFDDSREPDIVDYFNFM